MSKTVSQLKHFIRNDEAYPAVYDPNATLPPRDLFTGNGELLAAYDTFVRLQEARRENDRAAIEKRGLAGRAAIAYKTAVAEAMRQGTDPAKVKNAEPQLMAEVAAHETFAADALLELNTAGHTLGTLMQIHGADYFEAAEQQMLEAVKGIEAHVEALREAWTTWGASWGLRFHLSQVVNRGGRNQHYQAASIPPDVAAALSTVADTLHDLDNLKAEEALLKDWRDDQAKARAANAKAMR